MISTIFNSKQQVFIDFVLSHYISVGVEELDQAKLTPLLRLANSMTRLRTSWLIRADRNRLARFCHISEISLSATDRRMTLWRLTGT